MLKRANYRNVSLSQLLYQFSDYRISTMMSIGWTVWPRIVEKSKNQPTESYKFWCNSRCFIEDESDRNENKSADLTCCMSTLPIGGAVSSWRGADPMAYTVDLTSSTSRRPTAASPRRTEASTAGTRTHQWVIICNISKYLLKKPSMNPWNSHSF